MNPRGRASLYIRGAMLAVAILLPTLSAARQASRLVACGSNLRQVGIAIHTYAHDHDGNIPYGPIAGPSLTAANFYPATGTPTSLVTLLTGKPVGLGLALETYLAKTPKVLFCPGEDQPTDSERELAKVGITQAQVSYYYRHGSVVRQFDPPGGPPRPEHIRLSGLGNNRDGKPIRVLAMDTQFDVGAGFGAFGIVPRTHHGKKTVNALMSDGSVQRHDNADGRFTIRLDTIAALTNAFGEILAAFEAAE